MMLAEQMAQLIEAAQAAGRVPLQWNLAPGVLQQLRTESPESIEVGEEDTIGFKSVRISDQPPRAARFVELISAEVIA